MATWLIWMIGFSSGVLFGALAFTPIFRLITDTNLLKHLFVVPYKMGHTDGYAAAKKQWLPQLEAYISSLRAYLKEHKIPLDLEPFDPGEN